MAETVTGYLQNLAGLPIGAKFPVLVFTGRAPVAGSGVLHVTDPIRVPIRESDGFWTAQLVAAMSTIPETVYDLAAEWNDPNAYGPDVGMSRKDIIRGIRIPVGGGTITDILASSAQGWFWTVTSNTEPPLSKPGDLVWNIMTHDIFVVTA